MKYLLIAIATISAAGCSSTPNKVESVQQASRDGDIESGTYNDDRTNENMLVTVQSLRSKVDESQTNIFNLEKEVQLEKLKNASLVQESNVLRARAGIPPAPTTRDTASVKGWDTSGNPILEHKTIVEP